MSRHPWHDDMTYVEAVIIAGANRHDARRLVERERLVVEVLPILRRHGDTPDQRYLRLLARVSGVDEHVLRELLREVPA